LHQEEGFIPTTLAGHRQEVKAAWFSDDQETIYTVSKDGAIFDWKYMGKPDAIMENGEGETAVAVDERWRISERHYFLQNNAHLTCAAFHTKSNLLVAGFSNGIFGLYELPEFNQIHTLR
jgi:periodic tryptophan protein 2